MSKLSQKLRLWVLLCCCLGAQTAALASLPQPPRRYEAISSVVLQYRWFKFPTLGVISVDIPKNSFALAGMSQLGVSVFELSEKKGKIQSRMPAKLLQRNPNIAASAVADVRHMFFDITSPQDAKPTRTKRNGEKIYTVKTAVGTLEYHIEPVTGHLLEKRLLVPRRFLPGSTVAWVVQYEDYKTVGNTVFAQTIRFKQRQFHYAITSYMKEMRLK